jgi:hypothetical protein
MSGHAGGCTLRSPSYIYFTEIVAGVFYSPFLVNELYAKSSRSPPGFPFILTEGFQALGDLAKSVLRCSTCLPLAARMQGFFKVDSIPGILLGHYLGFTGDGWEIGTEMFTFGESIAPYNSSIGQEKV